MVAAPTSAAQRLALAERTRGLLVGEVSRLLPELGAAVQERLTALMNETGTSREMQSRRDAWLLYQKVQSVWLQGIEQSWQTACRTGAAAAAPRRAEAGAELSLVDSDEIDSKILSSRLVLGLMEPLGGALEDLRLRIQFLDGRGELSTQDILRPDVLLLPLVAQWVSSGMPREAWPRISDVVQRLLAERLPSAYARCNQLLIEQGVLPTIDLKDRVKRSPAATPPATGTAAPVPAPPASAASAPTSSRAAPRAASEGGQTNAAPPGDAVAARPAPVPRPAAGLPVPRPRGGLFGGRLGWDGQDDAAGGPPGLEAAQPFSPGAPLQRSRQRVQGVMGQLRALLAGPAGDGLSADTAPATARLITPALAAALTTRLQDVGQPDGATWADDTSPAGVARLAGALRAQSSALKRQAATRNEKATIEIVALMFQAILTEERIPPAIRVWFARLQMPVLRVALAEPAFFDSPNHPARQLIDRMGSCVMGFDVGDVGSLALAAEVKRIVQMIEQYPETGRQVFEVVYGEFEQFLERFLTGGDSTRKVVSVAQQVEQKETLTIQYTIELRKLLKDMPVRDEIRDFLFKVWAEVLAVAAVRQGLQHADTVALRKAATDLVWAASAKPNRSDRSRVIQDLPQLLQRLRSGMALLGMAAAEQEGHIKTVSDTLADAFLAKTQPIAPAQIEALAQRLAELEYAVSDDSLGELQLDAGSIELLLGIDASNLEVVANGGVQPTPAMRDWAQALQPGDWFTLDHNGRIARVQFVWRSDRKQLNLFASAEGRSYLIQAGRLAAYLQAGLLLPQQEETLTERATRDALTKLQANPERLLG